MANSKDVVVTGVFTGMVVEAQRCLFQRDFACLVLFARRLTKIVCKRSSGTASSANPVRIHEIYMRWIGKFEKRRLDALHNLKLALKEDHHEQT
jgi:hypothetical protein